MSNFYLDNEDIKFHLKHMDLTRVINLKENYFSPETKAEIGAPRDQEDAVDNYNKILEIVGEIAGDFIAPRATDVDREGASFADGKVSYARGTQESLKRLKDAELMGFTLPREFGGLNLPKIIYSIAIEMISRADASLMNLFGLQEIADTIYKFGSEEQRKKYLPRFSSGEVTGAMALTEPDAGSDLQAVTLRAHQNAKGEWRLNGVKRFITNGLADVQLVMARSEEGSTDGRGISLFIYERDQSMKIRRIEHKLGIHGSPTCELQFDDAKAELLGKRRMGLIRYTMSLMNGARLGVSAQAIGIAEAAYREAKLYAGQRVQFKKVIEELPPVNEMLTDMKTTLEAARSLLYETSRIVDIKEGLEERIEKHPESKDDLSSDLQRYSRFAALFTPMLKAFATEGANKVCYDALQVHAGVGYTTDFSIERLYRDVRITNIYEGTTQLQVVAAIGGIMTGVLQERLNEYENLNDFTSFAPIIPVFELVHSFRTNLESGVAMVKQKADNRFQDYHARRITEIAADTTVSYLLCIDALRAKCERKASVAAYFADKAHSRIIANLNTITTSFEEKNFFEKHSKILG